MSPWLVVLILIVALYLLIMAVLSVRDFYFWYRDGREFAVLRRQAKEQRRQRKLQKQQMPALKERPEEPSKASGPVDVRVRAQVGHALKPTDPPGR